MSESEHGNASSIIATPLRVTQAIELAAFVGREFAPGRWLSMTQDANDRFVALTGDRNWIHTDVARATQALPAARTIVPGQLLLALVPTLLQEAYAVTGPEQGMVAAIRSVRFRQPVHPGDAFRLRARLTLVERRKHFVQVDTACDLELMSGRRALTSQRTDTFHQAAPNVGDPHRPSACYG
jgi:acyl dehydratase